MEDPKRQAWLYLVVGALAVASATYFLSTQGNAGTLGIFDWVILGMGLVAVYRGVRGLLALRRGEAPPTGPAARPGPAAPTKITRPAPGKGRPGKPEADRSAPADPDS